MKIVKNEPGSIIGNEAALKFVDKIVALSSGQSIGGSFVFSGPVGAGKKTLARIFINKLLCEERLLTERPCRACEPCRQLAAGVSGDVFWLKLEADKKNIAIEQVRDLIRSLKLSSFGSGYKVAVLEQAEALSRQAANALLKTLEEPNKKTLIILLAADAESLPKTILSRSQLLNLKPVAPGEIYDFLVKDKGLKRSQAKLLSALALGRPGLACKFLADEQTVENHLAAAQFFYQAGDLELNDRLGQAADFLEKFSPQELLDIWQAVSRDWLLAKYQQTDWLRYQTLFGEVPPVKLALPSHRLLAWHKLLGQAREYLAANVSPKLVIENFLINL